MEKTFEYRVEKINIVGIRGHRIPTVKVEAMLMKMGEQGFELVSVVPIVGFRGLLWICSTVSFIYTFKKEVK